MSLVEERPLYRYVVHAADATSARVNALYLTQSVIVMPTRLFHPWKPTNIDTLQESDLEDVFALKPELILLGTGARQRFPAPALLAHCAMRGIGLETMTNDAAARTYAIVAAEQRQVALALLLPGQTQLASHSEG